MIRRDDIQNAYNKGACDMKSIIKVLGLGLFIAVCLYVPVSAQIYEDANGYIYYDDFKTAPDAEKGETEFYSPLNLTRQPDGGLKISNDDIDDQYFRSSKNLKTPTNADRVVMEYAVSNPEGKTWRSYAFKLVIGGREYFLFDQYTNGFRNALFGEFYVVIDRKAGTAMTYTKGGELKATTDISKASGAVSGIVLRHQIPKTGYIVLDYVKMYEVSDACEIKNAKNVAPDHLELVFLHPVVSEETNIADYLSIDNASIESAIKNSSGSYTVTLSTPLDFNTAGTLKITDLPMKYTTETINKEIPFAVQDGKTDVILYDDVSSEALPYSFYSDSAKTLVVRDNENRIMTVDNKEAGYSSFSFTPKGLGEKYIIDLRQRCSYFGFNYVRQYFGAKSVYFIENVSNQGWTNMRIFVNLKDNTYSSYIDDRHIGTDVILEGKTADELMKLYAVMSFSMYSRTGGKNQFKYVAVYNAPDYFSAQVKETGKDYAIITFSVPVDDTSLNASTVKVDGTGIKSIIPCNDGTNSYRINFSQPLRFPHQYLLTLNNVKPLHAEYRDLSKTFYITAKEPSLYIKEAGYFQGDKEIVPSDTAKSFSVRGVIHADDSVITEDDLVEVCTAVYVKDEKDRLSMDSITTERVMIVKGKQEYDFEVHVFPTSVFTDKEIIVKNYILKNKKMLND